MHVGKNGSTSVMCVQTAVIRRVVMVHEFNAHGLFSQDTKLETSPLDKTLDKGSMLAQFRFELLYVKSFKNMNG